jgi:hypothetical protein
MGMGNYSGIVLFPDVSGSQSIHEYERAKSGHTIGRSCSHCDSVENDLN